MTYRDHLAAATARKEALERELRDRQRELESLRGVIADLDARVRLPVLDRIRVAAPCAARWDDMVGDDRVRHCAACDQDVYNLSELTRDEAEALIVRRRGKLCARYYERADGTVMTADCPDGVRARRRRRVVAAGVAASLAGSVAGYVATRDAHHAGCDRDDRVVMGEVAVEARAPTPAPASPETPAPPPVVPELRVTMGLVAPAVDAPAAPARRR